MRMDYCKRSIFIYIFFFLIVFSCNLQKRIWSVANLRGFCLLLQSRSLANFTFLEDSTVKHKQTCLDSLFLLICAKVILPKRTAVLLRPAAGVNWRMSRKGEMLPYSPITVRATPWRHLYQPPVTPNQMSRRYFKTHSRIVLEVTIDWLDSFAESAGVWLREHTYQ